MKQKTTRRQKDISRLLRDKKKAQRDKLSRRLLVGKQALLETCPKGLRPYGVP